MQTNHLAFGAAAPYIAQQSTRSINRKRNSCSLAFWWITFNFRELDSLDTSNSVAAATVVDGNQLRIPQGKKNNLEAPRVLSGVAHREYSGKIHRLNLAPSDSQFIVAALTFNRDRASCVEEHNMSIERVSRQLPTVTQ